MKIVHSQEFVQVDSHDWATPPGYATPIRPLPVAEIAASGAQSTSGAPARTRTPGGTKQAEPLVHERSYISARFCSIGSPGRLDTAVRRLEAHAGGHFCCIAFAYVT